MSWFWIALAATLAWGGADLFYKLGANESDRYSHLKTSVFVGLCFGLHAAFTLIFGDIGFDWRNIYRYLPVSFMYILSMTVGYLGLRYLELSISSPVQNCSGAITAILGIVILHEIPDSALTWIGIAACCLGVIGLGVFEKRKRDADSQLAASERKYHVGFVAFLIPIAYCIIDTLGTFLDDPCLDIDSTWLVNVTEDTIEEVGNTAYELTFLIVGLILLAYILIDSRRRGEKVIWFETHNRARLIAGIFETAGQYAYAHVIGGNAVVAAPMIASYCMVSVLLSRVFLKEKLPKIQYVCILIAFAGILLLGLADGLAGDF